MEDGVDDASGIFVFYVSEIAHQLQNYTRQEVQLSLTNRPTLVHDDVKISSTQNDTKHSFPCSAAKNCRLANDCDLLAGFSDFYLPLSHFTLSIPSSYRVYICYGKIEWLGYNLVKVAS